MLEVGSYSCNLVELSSGLISDAHATPSHYLAYCSLCSRSWLCDCHSAERRVLGDADRGGATSSRWVLPLRQKVRWMADKSIVGFETFACFDVER